MKNAYILLIDALRSDVVADPLALRYLAPNLAGLAERSLNLRAVANAQATQFVMPALFTSTYPLDYGGYNDGIRDRPKSFVELIKDAGYETYLLATANQLGLSLGYQRGFNVIGTTSDYRTQVEYRISRTMRHDIERYKRGEIDENTIIANVRTLMAPLLDGLIDSIERHDRTIWPPALERINRRVAEGSHAEKQLLATKPKAVLAKLLRIAPGLYWRYLGREHIGGTEFFAQRLLSAISWRSRGWLANQTLIPFLVLQHYQAIAGDVVAATTRFVERKHDKPWFVHMHLMDLHDCRALNRFGHVLGLFRHWPRWLAARLCGYTTRRFLYDATLMYVDREIGDLLRALGPKIEKQEAVLVVLGDHGSRYAESPRSKPPIGGRMFYEDIDIGMIFANGRPAAAPSGLIDTMGITVSLLDEIGIAPHPTFKGRGLGSGGRSAVVTESCGSGYADLVKGDMYFAVTSRTHRLHLLLTGSALTAKRLFDHRSDPRELNNIVDAPESGAVRAELIESLFEERGDLLNGRGVAGPGNVAVAPAE